ncbi:MAG: uracil-DNA glycosylase family protein, partial [Shewanella sp.]
IVPMGFCFPGTIERNGKKQGDKPPRPECAATWHAKLLALMPQIELVLVLGQYAIDYHLPRTRAIDVTDEALNSQAIVVSTPQANKKITVTQAIEQWSLYWPRLMVMPHPSPRNNLWLKQHPEFEREQLPTLQARIADLLESTPNPK